MTWYVYYTKDNAWKIANVWQDDIFCLIIETKGNDTTPLIVKPGETVEAANGDDIKENDVLALDEKFSLSLSQNPESITINGSPIAEVALKDANSGNGGKVLDKMFNNIFCDGASESGDGEFEKRGFGLYSLEIKNGTDLPPLLLEIYPGFKIGFYYKGKKEKKPIGRYKAAREFFQAMTDKLSDSELILSLVDPAAIRSTSEAQDGGGTAVRKKTKSRTEMTDYWFFLKHADSIQKALKHIRRIPHKVLGQMKEHRRIDDISFYDPDLGYEIAKAPQYLQPLAFPNKKGIFEKNGKRYLPDHVLVNMLEETYDNPENRFLLHVAALFHSKLRAVETWMQKRKEKPIPEKIERLRKALLSFRRQPDFHQLRQSSVEPLQSKVLTKTPGYKEMASIWRQYGGLDFNKGLLLLDTIIKQKKWHELYELYCLVLLDEKLKLKCRKRSAEWSVGDKNNKKEQYLMVSVQYEHEKDEHEKDEHEKDNYALLYNHSFQRGENEDVCCDKGCDQYKFPGGTSGSKLDPFRPDFVLFNKMNASDWNPYYLLDAKFMVAEKMPDNKAIDEYINNEKKLNNYFQETVAEIERKYLNRNKKKGIGPFGCGIFLKGSTPFSPMPKGEKEDGVWKINFCIALAFVDHDLAGVWEFPCNACDNVNEECKRRPEILL